MLNIYYKYNPRMFVIRKTKREFLKDFLLKHFNDFLNGKVGLYVSPLFDNSMKLFQLAFDCDQKRVGNKMQEVIADVKRLASLFNKQLHIVTTQNGFHCITYGTVRLRRIRPLDINHFLKPIMEPVFPSIDWQGSIRVVPFGRLGLAPSGIYMNPIRKLDDLERADSIKKKIPSEYIKDREWWMEYFNVGIFPNPKIVIDLNELAKNVQSSRKGKKRK